MSDTIRTTPHPTCDVCGSEGFMLYEALNDRLFGVAGSYSYRKCHNPACGLIWQDPMILPDDILYAYNEYYTHHKGQMDNKGAALRRLARIPAHLFDSLFMRICGIKQLRNQMRYLGMKDLSPGCLLEIGCGRGEKLSQFKKLGWTVFGQDIDPKAVEYAQKTVGLDVYCGDLMSLGLKPEQFDAIIINHVIEHVFDVVALSAECFRLLKVGGRVVIVTPNGESLGHQKFQKDWRGLEPPRHIHIFSANSLNTLLLKAGFAHIDVSSKAASPRGVFEASYQLRDIGRSYVEKYPKTAIYYKSLFYQYREWYLCRKLQSVGEELLATAIK